MDEFDFKLIKRFAIAIIVTCCVILTAIVWGVVMIF